MSQNPLALITGAAQGIGYACAEALKTEGFDVILSDINVEGLSSAAKNLGAVASIVCDMADPEQIESSDGRKQHRGFYRQHVLG